ncbi:hypothetical protein EJB05_04499, partial [Eragrostis curvula]
MISISAVLTHLCSLNSVREASGSITHVWVSHQKQDSRGNGFVQHAGIYNEFLQS